MYRDTKSWTKNIASDFSHVASKDDIQAYIGAIDLNLYFFLKQKTNSCRHSHIHKYMYIYIYMY